MRHLDLFAGIGGFSLAVDWTWPNNEHIFVEIDPFCQQILRKHWSSAKIYGDIKKFTGKEAGQVDILTGGFPCQGFSNAGKRLGTADPRFLWPEMFRVIQEVKPTWVVAENVRGLLSIEGGLVFQRVCADLEDAGYEVQSFVIPACGKSAPHRRERVWIVGYTADNGHQGRCQETRTEVRESQEGGMHESAGTDRQLWNENWSSVALRTCLLPVDDGLSRELVRYRKWRMNALKAAGNAIVPAVAYEILKTIKCVTEKGETDENLG